MLLLEGLERDVSTGSTPQRRELSYPRYLAATSPHERILQRYRAARAAQQSGTQPDQIELPEFSASVSGSTRMKRGGGGTYTLPILCGVYRGVTPVCSVVLPVRFVG